MRNTRLRTIAEIGLCAALFAVLDYLNVRLPINIAGGSISLAMTPILVLALIRGPKAGVICGVLCGLVDLMIAPYIYSVWQVIVDYPLAFGLVGLAGVLKTPVQNGLSNGKYGYYVAFGIAGVIIGTAARLGAHVVSGVLFFASNAPVGDNALWYSLTYNLSYMAPSALAVGLTVLACLPAVSRYVSANGTE